MGTPLLPEIVVPELLLPALLLVPVVTALAVVACHRRPNLREGASLAGGVVVLLLTVWLYQLSETGIWPRWTLAEPLPGLALALSLEPLGLLFALVAAFLWPVTTLYAIGYMRAEGAGHQTRFYAAFAVAIAATFGVALADNLLTLFVCYELLTLATYPLVTHKGNAEARAAGRLYLGMLMATSMLLMLPAIIWTWQLAGTLQFRDGGVLPPTLAPGALSLLLLLFVLGTGKAALMPLHRWLPAAMVAPTPVSALLHAVAVVKAGVFTILKVGVYIFGLDTLSDLWMTDALAYLAGFGILAASLVAMGRDNLKARLAYSTVSQLGYVVMGALLGVASGVVGAGMHIAMHAFAKISLFFCAGMVLVAVHKTAVSELDGLGRQMPWTMGAFMVAALSVVGLPPLGGTWSKWMLLQGTLDSGLWLLMGVLLVSSLLNIVYLLAIPVRAFFRPPEGRLSPSAGWEAPPACLAALGITVAGSVLLFLLPGPLFELATEVLP